MARKNFPVGVIATAPSPATSGTSFVLQSGQGALMPSVPFYATASPTGVLPTQANSEIVRVTAVSSNTLTIVRAQRGTTARVIAVGWMVYAAIYAEDLDGFASNGANSDITSLTGLTTPLSVEQGGTGGTEGAGSGVYIGDSAPSDTDLLWVDPDDEGGSGSIASVVAGANIEIDKTDAHNPVISAPGTSGRLPVMTIINDGGVDPVDQDNYIGGTYTITDNYQGVVNSGTLTMKGRGNSTWSVAKKGFKLKFDTAAAPLGMTAVQKTWGLQAMWFDRSLLGNAFAFTLGQGLSGLAWTPEYRFIELIMNNTYRGVYQINDLVENKTGRMPGTLANADTGSGLTGNYLLEITNKEQPGNPSGTTPEPGFYSSVLNQWIIYKDPEELTPAQETYIQGYVTSFETALNANDGSWTTYADGNSFADWWLINELIRSSDTAGFWSSCKIWKERDGLLKMGPLWDQDLSLGVVWDGDDINTGVTRQDWYIRSCIWIQKMWDTDLGFRLLAKGRWQLILDRIDEMGGLEVWMDKMYNELGRAIEDDKARWPDYYTTKNKYLAQNADFRKRWLRARLNWITTQLEGIS